MNIDYAQVFNYFLSISRGSDIIGGRIVLIVDWASVGEEIHSGYQAQGRWRQLRFERCHDGDLTDFHLQLAADYRSRHRILTDPQFTFTTAA